MADVSIVGAAGYTGQETLDRVLGHPSLRLVAVGSDSLAGQPGGALDPRLAQAAMPSFVTNDEALAHDADVTILCLSHEAAAAIEPPATGVVVDLSGAHRLRDASALRGLVRLHPPASRRARRLGLRADRARRRVGAPRREPRVLRDRDPARARAAEGRDRARLRRRRRALRDDGSGPHAEGSPRMPAPCSRTSRRIGSAPISMCPRSRSCSASRSPSRRTSCPSGAVSSRPATSAPPALTFAPCSRRPTPAVPSSPSCPRGWRRSSPAFSTPTAPRSASSSDRFTDRTIVICAEDNLGKGAAGQAIQNVNRALGLEPTAGLRLGGVTV